MKDHIPNLEMSDLLFIANRLQYLVKKEENLTSWDQVAAHGEAELTTTILGIEKCIVLNALFESKVTQKKLKDFEKKISHLADFI